MIGDNLVKLIERLDADRVVTRGELSSIRANLNQMELLASRKWLKKHNMSCVMLEPFSMKNEEDCATGDGKAFLHIPEHVDGLCLVYLHGEAGTAGVTGTMDVQIANVTQGADMLSTVLTRDSGETGSDTAATPHVIDGANSRVFKNDVLRVDYDAVQTTAAKGDMITLGFA